MPPTREAIGANTKIQLGAAAVVVMALLGYALRMESRITSLTETATASERWLERIELVGEKNNEQLDQIRVAIERLDSREVADMRLLSAEISRLKERITELEESLKK